MVAAAPALVDDEAPKTYDPEAAPNLDATALARIEKLALDPAQTSFTHEQRSVLEALGWDMKSIRPVHVAQFIYFCQGHGVDPFMREAMLFMTDDGPVPILQIGGFRRQAMRTGEYRGLDRFEFMDEDGEWTDGWSPKRGRPVACRTFAHRAGWVPTEGMVYTEEVEVYEWVPKPGSAERVKRLTRRWETGQGLMGLLQKCAEAAALRRTFPRELDGFYVPEEMERLRESRKAERLTEEATRGAAARAERFRNAEPAREESPDTTLHEGVIVETGAEIAREETMAAAVRLRSRATDHPRPEPTEEDPSQVVVEKEDAAPVEGEIAADEPTSEAEPVVLDEDTKVMLLRAELDFQAEILGVPAATLVKRWEDKQGGYGVALGGWDSTMLLRVVVLMRRTVASRLGVQPERWAQANVYAKVPDDTVATVDQLLGLV